MLGPSAAYTFRGCTTAAAARGDAAAPGTSSSSDATVPCVLRPPATRMRPPSVIAAVSDRGVGRRPAGRIRRARTSTATILTVGVSRVAPRPPITKATSPRLAAAACVVGAGSRPIWRTRPDDGTYSSTAALAVPLGRDPPAMTSRLPAAGTAAYRRGEGKGATTRGGEPGRQAADVWGP